MRHPHAKYIIAVLILLFLPTLTRAGGTQPPIYNYFVHVPAYDFASVGQYEGILITDKNNNTYRHSFECRLGGVWDSDCKCGPNDDRWVVDAGGNKSCYYEGDNWQLGVKCPDGSLAQIVFPIIDLDLQLSCQGGGNTSDEDDECLDCNSSGDPFNAQTGEQTLRHQDLALPKLGGLSRTYSTWNKLPKVRTATDLEQRVAQAAVDPSFMPFGPGWAWDYGIYLTTRGDRKSPVVMLHDKDGKEKIFSYSYNTVYQGTLPFAVGDRYVNNHGIGEIRIVDSWVSSLSAAWQLQLIRPDGEILKFRRIKLPLRQESDGTLIYAWRLESISSADMPRKELDFYYESSVSEFPGFALQLKTITDGNTVIAIHWLDHTIDLRQNRIVSIDVGHPFQTPSYTIRYSYLPGSNWGSTLSSVEISDNSIGFQQSLWQYSYDQTGKALLTHLTNGRGDETELFWGPTGPNSPDGTRGSRVIGSDGLVYDDVRITWATTIDWLDRITQTATISTLVDRETGARKEQIQTFKQQPTDARSVKLRALTNVQGPGCKNCGISDEATYYYSRNNPTLPSLWGDIQRMRAYCDADGIYHQLDYDYQGSVEKETRTINASICPTKSHIRTDTLEMVLDSATRKLFDDPIRLGVQNQELSNSVLSPGNTTLKQTTYADQLSLTAYKDCTYAAGQGNCWTTQLPVEILNKGYTRTIGGDIVEQESRVSITYRWEDNGVLAVQKDGPLPGNQTIYRYQGQSQILLSVTQNVGGLDGVTTELVTRFEDYDVQGNARTVISPRPSGKNDYLVTYYEYNMFNKVTKQTQRTYLGNLSQYVDVVTRFEYDGAGDLAKILLPEGGSIAYENTAYGYVKKITRKNRNGVVLGSVSYEYDPEGNRTRETVFDSANSPLRDIVSVFDQYNHISSILNSFGEISRTSSTSSGLLESDSQGIDQKVFTYDLLKRLAQVDTFPVSGFSSMGNYDGLRVTKYGRDSSSRIVHVSGSKNPDTGEWVDYRYLYDDFGRLVKVESVDIGVYEFEYDAAGNVVSQKDPRGMRSFYNYDAGNRLVSANNDDGGASIIWDSSPEWSADVEQNALGKLASIETGPARLSFGYDLQGRQTTETHTYQYSEWDNLKAEDGAVQYVYNNNGAIVQEGHPTGIEVLYNPDSFDDERVESVEVILPSGERRTVASFFYDDAGRPLVSYGGNGVQVQWSWDDSVGIEGALGSVRALDSFGNLMVGRTYNYKPSGTAGLGLVESVDDARFGFGWQYLYDGAGRVVRASSQEFGTISYGYDLLGNRLFDEFNGQRSDYTYLENSNRLVHDPKSVLGNAVQSNRDRTQSNALTVRILNELADLFFSGRRFISLSYGVGSFSESKAAYNRPSTESTDRLLFLKSSNTLTLLKAALADGSLTIDQVKTAASVDQRLQEQMDLFFDDVMAIPPTSSFTFLLGFASLFSQADVMLLGDVLDLASRIPPILPPISTSNTETDTNSSATWSELMVETSHLVRAAVKSGGLSEQDALLDDIHRKYRALKDKGLKPSKAILHLLENASVKTAVTKYLLVDDYQVLVADSGEVVAAASADPVYVYDEAGNLRFVNLADGSTIQEYRYDATGRMVYAWRDDGFGPRTFVYDGRGRLASTSRNSTVNRDDGLPLGSYLTEFFTWSLDNRLLSRHMRNMLQDGSGEETTEDFVYFMTQPLAKVVGSRRFGLTAPGSGGGGGGGGGGGSCCAATAIAYDGKEQCDLQAFKALQALRRFRSTVLSGNWLGEKVIRFYYGVYSPVVVPVLREYPELRHGSKLIMLGFAKLVDWIVPSASADLPNTPYQYQVYWYINDRLGTPLYLTNQQGNIALSVDRDPFGNPLVEASESDAYLNHLSDIFMFPGQLYFKDMKIAYNYARWYMPSLGRYMEADPILALGREGPAYSYAENNPLLFQDPFGLEAVTASLCGYFYNPVLAGFKGFPNNVLSYCARCPSGKKVNRSNITISGFPNRAGITDKDWAPCWGCSDGEIIRVAIPTRWATALLPVFAISGTVSADCQCKK